MYITSDIHYHKRFSTNRGSTPSTSLNLQLSFAGSPGAPPSLTVNPCVDANMWRASLPPIIRHSRRGRLHPARNLRQVWLLCTHLHYPQRGVNKFSRAECRIRLCSPKVDSPYIYACFTTVKIPQPFSRPFILFDTQRVTG